MSLKIYTEIWKRVIQPNKGNMSPEAAEFFLDWRFNAKDMNRMDALMAKARKRSLTEKELLELETYRRAEVLISVLHAKARLSLKQDRIGNVARAPRAPRP